MDFTAFLSAFTLKDRLRTGWVLREVRDPESVADHSWGTAFLCLLYAGTAGVDLERSLSIALVHDIAEAETGDIATRVHAEEQAVSREMKQTAEQAAIEKLAAGIGCESAAAAGGSIGGARIKELWEEYEAGVTPEARFVRDMNLIDMCLQALKYEKEKRYTENPENPNFKNFKGLDEFFATSGPRISTLVGKKLFRQICAAYQDLRGSRLP